MNQLMAKGWQAAADESGQKRGSAEYLIQGTLNTRDDPVKIYGMSMTKAVSTFSYRVLHNPSGQLVFADAVTGAGSDRSAESAAHLSLKKITGQVADALSKKISSASQPAPPPVLTPPADSESSPPVQETLSAAKPEIVMINPPDGRGFKRIKKEKFLLEGRVVDPSGPRNMTFTINSRPVRLDASGMFSHPVQLRSGKNSFLLAAVNQRNIGTTRKIEIDRSRNISAETPTPSGAKPVLWGLTVGVSHYADPGMNLRYADDDARAIAVFLNSQKGLMYAETRILILVNKSVTREKIMNAVSTHLGRAAPDDVVFIFMAGHGIRHRQSGSYYFMPSDSTHDTLLSKGLRTSDFEEAVNILSQNVRKVILVMDTCHSGAMNAGARDAAPGENLAEIMRFSGGLFILSASKGGELSYENARFNIRNDAGHGAFTFALLTGMMGDANYDKNSYISLGELFQYVSRRVPRITEGRQHPYYRMEGTDLPFVMAE